MHFDSLGDAAALVAAHWAGKKRRTWVHWVAFDILDPYPMFDESPDGPFVQPHSVYMEEGNIGHLTRTRLYMTSHHAVRVSEIYHDWRPA